MRKLQLVLSLFLFAVCHTAYSQVSLTGVTYSQNFNSLASSGSSNVLPAGWLLAESGSSANNNGLYTAGTGSSNAGDTYSFGAAANTERAFGGLRSGTLIPIIGAFFTNNTGGTITSLDVSYTGEQWRAGVTNRNAADRLDFQMSTNATAVNDVAATWTDINTLDFNSPNINTTAGALDGNAANNRTAISFTITSLNIPNGAVFYIRWTDFDITSSDDGLSVDDFSISTSGTGGISLSINDVSLAEGTGGTTAYNFTVSLSSPAGAGGVTFDITTQDNTATVSNGDYQLNSLTGQVITAGNSNYTFTVLVNGDGTPEANESFFVNVTNITGATAGDGQGVGTIFNDDCAPTHSIAQIQGNGNTSPLTGSTVTTSGIVTGIKTNGFFMQTPDVLADNDPSTSEGIFVFTAGVPPAAVVIGNSLCVTGTAAEFIPPSDPNSPSQTEIISPSMFVISTGNPLPAPVILTSADTDPAGGLYQLEKFECMRVAVPSLTVVAPTGGTVTESSATSFSSGYFFGVITGVDRPFREPGIQLPDPLPPGAPATVTRWDANPELIGVASRGLFNGTIIDVATGALLTNVVGPLDFVRRYYTINIDLPAITPLPVVSNNNLTFTPVPMQTSEELTVATFNLERFFDNVNDPLIGEPVLTLAAYNNRLNKVSLAIRNVLRSPDVIGIVEAENLTVLQTIATKINNDAVAAGDPNPNYAAYLVEGNDVGGIDVGFLVKSARVNVMSVVQYGKTATYINPQNGLPETLNDRPPLVLNGGFNKPGCTSPYPFTVIVNHLRSLIGVEDPADGTRVRAKRKAQAEYLANLIQSFQTADPAANIISVGDYNAFQFNDGYVDMIGTIKGTPTPPANVVTASPDLVDPDLADLVDTHTPDQRYSYSFAGNAQVLDHILVNQNALNKVSRFSIARLDADFPEVYRNDPTRPERISDHDAPVAYILYPAPSCTITAIPENNIYTGGVPTNIYLGYGPQSVTLQVNAVGDAPFTYSWTGSNLSCNNCIAPVFTPTSAGTYSFTVTVTNNYGCTTTCSITICVTDIRVPGTKGKKVYLCHAPPDNPANTHTLAISVNAVNEHLTDHPGDRLGQCDQELCTAPSMNVKKDVREQTLVEGTLKVNVSPNPSNAQFTIWIEGKNDLPVSVRVTDTYGRVIIQKTGVLANSYMRIGHELTTGLYYVEVKQGDEQRVLKLIKLK